jgi:chloramphenicol-sensitive protein RarD
VSHTKNVRKGLTLGATAYFIWGSFPLIITNLTFASPIEVVVWRMVFGFALAAVLVTVTRAWGSVLAVLKQPRMLIWVATASVFIYANWLIYVYGVGSHQVVETALGYFINPLVTILLAVFFLGEKLRPLQWVAVGFGALAVTVLTIDLGRLPWIALCLAGSFGIYGLAKNKLGGKVTALTSFTLESGILMPLALIQVFIIATSADGLKFASAGPGGSALLVIFGIMTAVPLILFGSAARNLPLSYIGFMQYLTPVIQFTLALTVLHEPMPPAKWIGFGLVWVGLAFLTTDALRKARSREIK